jgi:hypothetical protein
MLPGVVANWGMDGVRDRLLTVHGRRVKTKLSP